MKQEKYQLASQRDFRTISTQPFTAAGGVRSLLSRNERGTQSTKFFTAYNPEKLAPIQRTYGQHKPFLFPPQKYKGFKKANTGIDPHGGFLEFIKKDIIKNIDVHRDDDQQLSMRNMRQTQFSEIKNKWAVGTTKFTAQKVDNEGKIKPEFQSIMMKRSASQYQPIRLKTDVISFKPPEKQRENQREFDLKVTQSNYNYHSETKFPWNERTYDNKSIVNRSSVAHNIITHESNDQSGRVNIGTLNSKILFRKKSICDFSNEAIPAALHINKDFNSAFLENPTIFKKFTGICTNVYDAAHKYGISKPFKV